MANLRLLFDKRKLRTACCFWVDQCAKLRPITPPNIVGVGGEFTRVKEIAPICCLKLKFTAPIQQLVFRQPNLTSDLLPIYRDSEKYPLGEIY